MLLDADAPPEQWIAGVSRRLIFLAQNVDSKPIHVPISPQSINVFSWGAQTRIDDAPESCIVFGLQERRFNIRPRFPFAVIEPNGSFGVAVPLTPRAPGEFEVTVEVGNQLKTGTELRPQKLSGGMTVAKFVQVDVPDPWLGRLKINHVFKVVAVPSDAWNGKRDHLARLVGGGAAAQEELHTAFGELTAGEDWWTWLACCEVLDRLDCRALHAVARQRIEALFVVGLPFVDWQQFVRRLDGESSWQPLRGSAVPLIARVASGGVSPEKVCDIAFEPSDKAQQEARAILEKWAAESSGEVSAAARTALGMMTPIPPGAMERGIAGKPPGPTLPTPIPMPAAKPDGTVKVSMYWSMYYLAAKTKKELAKVATDVSVDIYGRDKETEWDGFDRGDTDIYALAHDPRLLDTLLRERYPDPAPWPSSYWLGDSVACIVVHPRNPIAALNTTTLRHILFASDAPGWDIAGGRPVQINRYVEAGGRTGDVVKAVIGGGSSYENNKTVACPSPAELIEKVASDPNAIGFMRFGSDVIKADKKVKIIAIQRDMAEGKAVLPSMETISDGSYPLSERMTLLAKPDASPATTAFLSVAAHMVWKTIGDDSGFWPTSEIRRWREEQRLEQLKAGKAAKVTVVGPSAAKGIVEAACLAFTRDEVAIKPAYSVAKEGDALRRLMAKEADLLVSDGALTPDALAPYAKELPELELRSVPLGRSGVAIVIHPANTIDSITIEQLQGVLSGNVREWWFELPGSRIIKRFGPPATDDGLSWLADRLKMPVRSLKLEHRRTAAEILTAVASDPQAIGVLSLSEVPAETGGVVILPVATAAVKDGQGKGLRPDDDGYPFARTWFLHTHGRASPAARLLVERLSEQRQR
jgi:phosphate transport system substrate-binding protein